MKNDVSNYWKKSLENRRNLTFKLDKKNFDYKDKYKKYEKIYFFKFLLFIYRYFKVIKIINRLIMFYNILTNSYIKKGKKIYFKNMN